MKERNLTMLMDYYELTMSYCYFNNHETRNKKVTFDLFYRKNPDNGGFVICAGLEQLIDYVKNLKFTDGDIEYLRSRNTFSEEFLQYLKDFKFTGTIYAIEEGVPVYPREPLVRVSAPIIEAQIVETAMLLTINHQSLIATKANRIVRASKGRVVSDFGARRAHGPDGAVFGARACYIGGVDNTATVLAGKKYGMDISGTMAHSFIQSFGNTHESEYEAFLTWAKCYPDRTSLLIDTYDVLNSGLPNAIRVAKEYLEPIGKRLASIRIDSGDLAYLSKKIRNTLDENFMQDCKIVLSNSLDEYTITSLEQQGACFDILGVGERMITSKSDPVFGGVYKLSAVMNNDTNKWEPRIKKSENIDKITYPGVKKIYRLTRKNTQQIAMDIICLDDEILNPTSSYWFVDPKKPWFKINSDMKEFEIEELLKPIFIDGKCVYTSPTLDEIKNKCKDIVDNHVYVEEKRFEFPHEHYVNLSPKLYELQMQLLNDIENENKQ